MLAERMQDQLHPHSRLPYYYKDNDYVGYNVYPPKLTRQRLNTPPPSSPTPGEHVSASVPSASGPTCTTYGVDIGLACTLKRLFNASAYDTVARRLGDIYKTWDQTKRDNFADELAESTAAYWTLLEKAASRSGMSSKKMHESVRVLHDLAAIKPRTKFNTFNAFRHIEGGSLPDGMHISEFTKIEAERYKQRKHDPDFHLGTVAEFESRARAEEWNTGKRAHRLISEVMDRVSTVLLH